MEENKNVATPSSAGGRPIPPPPPRPVPPPPRPQAAPGAAQTVRPTSSPTTVAKPTQTAQPRPTVQARPVESARNDIQTVRQLEKENDRKLEEDVKRAAKNIEKPKASKAAIFYWLGFVACLVGIGVMVFLLI